MKRLTLIASAILATMAASAHTQQEILDIMRGSSTLPDLVNTDPKVFEDAAETTFRAMSEMPWGTSVPDREFRFFVAPLRVNNEPIDAHRPQMYEELSERVKDLSMEEAILEVNHWCHEYVTYQPSDGRTHSPLQSMSSCIGRCGEESTFTVAALRSVGIPARQVYTPRWAHTDDNHAWVEAWADGKWHFIGACEPEPLLDLAWFNAPATRGMMMHTFVRGDYDGPEEVVARLADGVNINVTSNYAPVTDTFVVVTDEEGNPVKDASVSFRVYNYAEFYPLTTKTTGEDGLASVTTGLGDMLVWAQHDGKFGFGKVSAGKENNIKIPLLYDASQFPSASILLDVIPPVQGTNLVIPTPEAKKANDIRFAQEDAIRKARTDRFCSDEEAERLAQELGLPADRVKNVMKDSRGNGGVIMAFLRSVKPEKRMKALTLLENVTVKDRCDITMEVLTDHLSAPEVDNELYAKYILSPRIEIEDLSPWRGYLSASLPRFESPESLAEWVKREIQIVPDWTPSAVTMHPEKVLDTKKGNKRSRDLFFVAASRALGFPARKDPVTGQIQWADNQGNWNTVDWEVETGAPQGAKGKLSLLPYASNKNDNPAYYYQFSISKIEDGTPHLMEYDEKATWIDTFSSPVEMDCGEYVLTTGQRLANGGVLAKMDFFRINENETTPVELAIRHDESAVEVIGGFNSENLYTPVDNTGKTQEKKSILSTTGRGFYILGILNTGHEPSNHTVRDIAAVKDEFEALGIPMVMLFAEGNNPEAFFNDALLPALPAQTSFGIDADGMIAAELTSNLKLLPSEKPIFVIADTFNRVVFVTQGYTIGLGRTLLDTLSRI